MSWASFEDFCADVPVIVPEPALCIGCEQREPEDGADHCATCLERLDAICHRMAQSIASAGTKPYQTVSLSMHDSELQYRQAQAQRLK